MKQDLTPQFILRMLQCVSMPRVIEDCEHETFPEAIRLAREKGVSPTDVIIWLTKRGASCDCTAALLMAEPVAMVAAVVSYSEEARELFRTLAEIEPGDYETFERTIKPMALQLERTLDGFRVWDSADWGI